MRPSLRVIPEPLLPQILAEAKRLLAEIGVEVRGPRLKERLLAHGLRTADTAGDGERMLFPPEVVEWAVKLRLLQRYADARGLPWADRRLAQVDLACHDLTNAHGRPRGLFRLLEARGAFRRVTTPDEVRSAMTDPPTDTRAVLRSRCLTAAQAAGRHHSIDWAAVTVRDVPGDQGRRDVTVRLGDPFATTSADVDALIDAIEHGWRPPV